MAGLTHSAKCRSLSWLQTLVHHSHQIQVLVRGRQASCNAVWCCVVLAGPMLAAAGVDFDAALFQCMGPEFVARLMHKTGEGRQH